MRSPRISDWAETQTEPVKEVSRAGEVFDSGAKWRDVNMFADDTQLYVWNQVLFITPVRLTENVRLRLSDSVTGTSETFSFITAKSFVWFHRSFSHCESFCWSQSLATGSSAPVSFQPKSCHNMRPQLPKQNTLHFYHEQMWVVVERRRQTPDGDELQKLIAATRGQEMNQTVKTTRCDVKTSIVFCNVSPIDSFFCCVSNTLPWKPKINQTEILFFPFSVHRSTLFLEIRKHFGNVFGYKIIDGIFLKLMKKIIYSKIQ